MVRLLGSRASHRRLFQVACLLVVLLVHTCLLLGQATPCCGTEWSNPSMPGTTWNQPNSGGPQSSAAQWGPFGNSNPGTIMNAPNPNFSPTRDQTQWYLNNHPALSSLDSATKTNIANGAAPFLHTPYLPNGQSNPFYQNGQLTPNWYVPSTWSSPTMSWQGVQPNGYMPSTYSTYSSYNPSSFSNYNQSSNTTNYNVQSYQPNYNPQRTVQPQQNPVQRPSQTPIQPWSNIMQATRPSGPSPGDLNKAFADHERALALSATAGDKVGQAIHHAELARLFIQQGKPEEALAHLSAAEPMARINGDPRFQADLLQIKGAAYVSSGEFEKSIDVYRQAIESLRSVDDSNGEAELFTSLGWAYQSLGDIPNALRSYGDAQKLFAKAGNKDGQARIALGLGSLYQSMGKTEKVEDEYTKALPIVSLVQYARMIASVADILLSRNQPKVALARYKKALSVIQPTTDATMEGSILAGMGRCDMALGAYDEARQNLELARTKMLSSGNKVGEAGIIASLGELEYWTAVSTYERITSRGDQKGHFQEALKNYGEGLALMRVMGDRAGEIGVLTDTGLVYDAWGKPNQALTYYLDALQKLDTLQTSARLEEFRMNLAEQSTNLYQRAVLLEVSQHHLEEAFNLSERARARTFLDQLGNDRVDLRNHLPEDFGAREEKLRRENISLVRQLGQELAKPGPEINPERTALLQSRLTAVRHDYEELLNQLKLSSPEYASFLSIAPLTLQEAQRQLSPEVTLVSYFTTPAISLAFVLTKESFHVTKLPVSELQLNAAVSTLLDFSGTSEASNLKPLYKLLIAPIKSQLKTPVLAVAPYGPLHDLPFAALTPDGTHYLSDDYVIVSLPSVSVLPYLQARMKSGGSHILVFANNKEPGLPYLRHTDSEARAVAAVYGATPNLGGDATAAVFRANAGNYDIVHLAGHIDRNKQSPQFSRISMGQGKEDDGSLELNQIYGLDLRQTDLVVLSGCQSQNGKRSRGDDVISLSGAFMYAGAPSVIASLWDVDDEATQQLMVSFYTHLRDGQGKAEALRAAQAETRQKYPNPYYWAGFVLTGDPGKTGSSPLLASSRK